MTQLYYGLVTAVGTAKLAASAAGGASLALSSMAFGDGGGVETSPTTAATTLVNERYRAMLVEKYPHPTNPSILYVEGIIPPGVGGWTLREAGIYDAAGDLIVIAKMPAVNVALISEGASTEGVVRLPIVFDSASSVQILIDPSVVLATQAWVLERVLGRPWITVDSATTTTPPANPAAHALYLVPAGATGVWAAQAHKLAYYLGGWRYYSTPTAKRVSASDTGKAYRRTAGGWEELWMETEVSNVISKSGIVTVPGSGMRLAQAIRSQRLNYVNAAGTANALTGTMDPVPADYVGLRGGTFQLVPPMDNTGPVTLAVGGLGALPIQRQDSLPLKAGDLIAGRPVLVTLLPSLTAWQILGWLPSFARRVLEVDLDIYVNAATGNDNNPGTAALPMRTLQAAAWSVQQRLDLNGCTVRIIASGAFSAGVSLIGVVPGQRTSSSLVFELGTSTVTAPLSCCFFAGPGAMYDVNGGTLSASGTGIGQGVGISVNGGRIGYRNTKFGVCDQAHVSVTYFGLASASGSNITIAGAAPIHVLANQGLADLNGSNISLLGTPNFSSAFAVANSGAIAAYQTTFVGAATGKRFSADIWGSIYVAGAGSNFFPGSIAGTVTAQGDYR